jgi:4-carboxymuconolactone decarboxylase
MKDRYTTGMEKRRSVLGDAYVDSTLTSPSDLAQPFQRLVAESVWGHIWSRPGLDDRTRTLLNIALLTALGRPHELKLYIQSRGNTGTSAEDVAEVLLHASIYCGIPAGVEAFKVLELTLAEEKAGGGKPA